MTEEAVAEISRLIDAGRVFFDADLYFGGDEWAGLRADPAFQALFDINSRRIEEQRSRIRQLEEEGKIARFPEELSSISIDVSSLIE